MSTISAGTTSTTTLVASGDTTGSLVFKTNDTGSGGTTAMTIDTSQNTTLAGTLTTSAKGIAKASLPAGAVLQVVQGTYSTQVSTSSSTFTDSGLTASITPTSSTSKILVLVSTDVYSSGVGRVDVGSKLQLVRGAVNLITQSGSPLYINTGSGSSAELITQPFVQYLDSPATTSSTTYKLQFATNGLGTTYINYSSNPAYITLMEIAA